MDFYTEAVKIIFDKILEACNIKDNGEFKSKFDETYGKALKKVIDPEDFNKFASYLKFTNESIKNQLRIFIENPNSKKHWVSGFLKVLTQILMNDKDNNSDEYKELKLISEESDKMLDENYSQNLEIKNNLYTLSVAFLKCNEEYTDILKQINLAHGCIFNNYKKYIDDSYPKIKEDDANIVKNFILSFADLIDLGKSFIDGIPREEQVKNNKDENSTEKKVENSTLYPDTLSKSTYQDEKISLTEKANKDDDQVINLNKTNINENKTDENTNVLYAPLVQDEKEATPTDQTFEVQGFYSTNSRILEILNKYKK
uniref:Uncharacterized protein n=1 Tax=viral metagenome TaxID=1070528 RepID=A0A6C0BE28_9ZZZZ